MTEPKVLKPLSFFTAVFPIICLVLLFACSIIYFKDDCSGGPNQIALFACAIVSIFIGLWRGLGYEELEGRIVSGSQSALGASLILLFVGSLISVWLLSGTVATIIFYGVQIISVKWFYASTIIVTSIVSLCIGSSWTAAGTIGVAFLGIAQALHLDPAITAGAIISGAYLGDKLSPLSETTNLAAAVTGSNLFDHIKNMFWTTFPSFLIALAIFTFLGFSINESQTALDTTLIDAIKEHFNVTILNLIPLLLLVIFAIMRCPALLTIFIGIVAGAVQILIFQTSLVETIFNHPSSIGANLIDIWSVAANGLEFHTENAVLNDLMSGGGMSNMLNTVFLIIAALTFGASLEANGSSAYLIDLLLKVAKTAKGMISTTIVTCFCMNCIAGEQFMSIAIPGRMFAKAYDKLNLKSIALSRSLEDGGTVTSVLVPWTTCSVYMMGVLGISCYEFIPYCFLNISSPFIAIIFAIFGIKIAYKDKTN